jgi:hypothetical protein
MMPAIIIMLLMPTISIQVPPFVMMPTPQVGIQGQHNGNNVTCANCGLPQHNLSDIKQDIKEEIINDEIVKNN